MKTIFTLLFSFSFILFNAQTACNPTTIPVQIYYPNTTNSPTVNAVNEFLCGPNTVVYDTLEQGCHFVYVNAMCTLFLKPTFSCAAQSEVWLKSNSILNIVQGSGLLQIYYEPGAIINNPFAVSVFSTTCSSISFLNANCAPSALNENIFDNYHFEIYPNPANDVLNIVSNNEGIPLKSEIVNSLGQVVREELLICNNGYNVAITELPNGIYTLNLVYQTHRSGKRFVIAK